MCEHVLCAVSVIHVLCASYCTCAVGYLIGLCVLAGNWEQRHTCAVCLILYMCCGIFDRAVCAGRKLGTFGEGKHDTVVFLTFALLF